MAMGNKPKWKAPHRAAPSKPERHRITVSLREAFRKGANTVIKEIEGRTMAIKYRFDNFSTTTHHGSGKKVSVEYF